MLGLFTRVASLFLVIFMIFGVQFTSQKGFFWAQGRRRIFAAHSDRRSCVLIRGGGLYSLDERMSREF